MRLLTVIAILGLLSACAGPATTFAGGLRGWCKSAQNCSVQEN